ncbi:MAG: TIGR00303 family protein [Propionibacteriaceae bacterium]|nr:TIGR00303 family protein [Propionibacteriaceae bacterium]MBT65844.1 TIGR00303 family protein [Synechococcus sp. NP17]
MAWSPSTLFEVPTGCMSLSGPSSGLWTGSIHRFWSDAEPAPNLLLLLSSTLTAEVEGISAAGATAVSRRYTAIADAELLLCGPSHRPRWPLPPLPAGVTPALISWVAAKAINIRPWVGAIGLTKMPPFAHLRFEDPQLGPASCISTGKSMTRERVQQLLNKGKRFGERLQHPLVLAECVPGGTTTALAILRGLGLPADELISGSAMNPPMALKRELVRQGLETAALSTTPSAQDLLAAVGDPFQAFATGLLIGSLSSAQPLLLAGGSQMAAVLALALTMISTNEKRLLCNQLLIGTTAWLGGEVLIEHGRRSALVELLSLIEDHFNVSVSALASGLRFRNSRHPSLHDYELGHVKEGVGAGGLALLAQLRGVSLDRINLACDNAMDQLIKSQINSKGLPRDPAP